MPPSPRASLAASPQEHQCAYAPATNCNLPPAPLQGCQHLPALQQLDASSNPITGLEALAPATCAALLHELDLRGCPLHLAQAARLHVLYMLPRLTQLDGRPAGAAEKVAAANMHGADAAGLVEVRGRWVGSLGVCGLGCTGVCHHDAVACLMQEH
jgi:hypothetical protein